MVDPNERIVLVEDAGELRPRHPHVVGLEARRPNVEGAGEIGLRTLVRQSLRMRPDRLVVGEVRGAEVVDLLAAMNTGHEGSCSTVHANSARDLPARFEALGVAAGLRRDAVHAQLASAIDVVLHLRRDRDGRRRLDEIGVLGVMRRFRRGPDRCPLPARRRGRSRPGCASMGRLAGRSESRMSSESDGRHAAGGRSRRGGDHGATGPPRSRLPIALAGGSTVLLRIWQGLFARVRARRSGVRRRTAVIELCDGLAAELHAGVPVQQALEHACRGDPEWTPVVVTARVGGDVVGALRESASRPGAGGLSAVAAAWEVSCALRGSAGRRPRPDRSRAA